ncbi:MAG: SRPBCC family protein, partial [Actinomycetota bacterium]
PARLVYTFKWERELPFPDGPYTKPSRVTVEFRDIGDDTEIVLTHEGFPSNELRDFHLGGWESSFDRLADLLHESPTFPR